MCDYIPGEILVAYQKDDAAAAALIGRIREDGISHVQFVESLEERLSRLELPVRPGLKSNFCRLTVPKGEEEFKANILQFAYREELFRAVVSGRLTGQLPSFLADTRNAFAVVVNSLLSPCFTFSQPRHDDYKSLFGWTVRSSTTRKVLIVDSGIVSAVGFNVTDEQNFVDWTKKNDVSDDHPSEHGTVVAEIVRDLCPQAPLAIFKVIDSTSRASEWDTLAALAVDCGASVINMSLAFGLDDQTCSYCGRESQSSRSAVFEKMLSEVLADEDVIVVGAAGNHGKAELAFPARFPQVVAVEAVNQAKVLSQFSNHSTTDAEGNPHKRVFVLPGGDQGLAKAASATEWVGVAKGTNHCGTSFAAAYASAIIAHLWDEPAHRGKTATQLIDHCAHNADKGMLAYTTKDYGNGLMQAI